QRLTVKTCYLKEQEFIVSEQGTKSAHQGSFSPGEDRVVRTNPSRNNDLTSLLARSEGPVRFSKRIDGRVSATWEVETKTLDGEDQPNGLQVKATCRQNRRTRARCAIAALAAYPPTPLAETPQPSHHRWTRRVGGVSPTPLRRFRGMLGPAALLELDQAALSTRSDGVLRRPPTP